jgi:SAM-dependent methyltransferase/uncharacterized protein YbaR (Trm112 family)
MSAANMLDPWLLANVVCPLHRVPLVPVDERLVCAEGHSYPVVHGIPVLLVDDAAPTNHAITQTLDEVSGALAMQNHAADTDGAIDPGVQVVVSATCGYLYQHLPGKLTRYPIPHLRLPAGVGQRFLDVGCNWGRWCVAARRKGYSVVGLDPDLGAIFSARRVCKSLSIEAIFVVGDARFLPFADRSFDVVFSYSVLQHFSKADARQALGEVSRTLGRHGTSFIQMPNAFGVRSLYHLVRHGFARSKAFDVRYWTPRELRKTFTRLMGPSDLSVDGFGGLGIQSADRDLFPPIYRVIVDASEFLRRVSRIFPPLANVADSIYVQSRLEPSMPSTKATRGSALTPNKNRQ